MYKRNFLVLSALLTIFATSSYGQRISSPGETIICYASNETHRSYLGPDGEFNESLESIKSGRISGTTIFEVDFFNVPTAGQATIKYATDIWAAVIRSDFPIKVSVTWKELSSGVLGSARPASREANFDGAPIKGVWYPIALAERLARKELNEIDEYEIIISLNQEKAWYFGNDGNVPENIHDLLSVALHEIGHGLGLSDTFDSNNGNGSWGWNTRANLYDAFIFNDRGLQLIDINNFENFSTILNNQIISGRLEYKSLSAQKVNNGAFPKVYAPAEFNSGSSISHLDENTYPAGDTNSLMSPKLSRGEAIHNTGPLVNAILADMGYVYTFIDVDLVADQPDWNADVAVNGKIKSDSFLIEDTAILIYSYDKFATSGQAPLNINTDQSQFTATIPAPGFKTFVEYYIVVADNNQITYRSPINDSEDNYRFGMGLVTGIEDSRFALNSLSVYPNPSAGKINISYSSENPNNSAVLRVTNLRGKIIHREMLSLLNGTTELTLNLQSIPSGMYIVEMICRTGSQRRSFIIR